MGSYGMTRTILDQIGGSAGSIAISGGVVILLRLAVISGHDPATAIGIAGHSDAFSLTIALALNALPILIASVLGAVLILAGQALAGSGAVPGPVSVGMAVGIVLFVTLVPISVTTSAPVVGGLVVALLGLLASRVPRLRIVVAGGALVAGGIILSVAFRGLLLEDRPFGSPRIWNIVSNENGAEFKGVLVGQALGSDGGYVSILLIAPRQIVTVPEESISSSAVCRLENSAATPRTIYGYATFRLLNSRAPRGGAALPPCFDELN